MDRDFININGVISRKVKINGHINSISIEAKIIRHIDILRKEKQKLINRKLRSPTSPEIEENIYSVNRTLYAITYDVFSDGNLLGSAYAIIPNLVNIQENSDDYIAIGQGDTVTLSFMSVQGYNVPTTIPEVEGATAVYTKLSDITCSLTLSNPTGKVSFTIHGIPKDEEEET